MITLHAIREAAALRNRRPARQPRRHLTADDLETIALLRDLGYRIEMGLPPFDKDVPFDHPGERHRHKPK